MKYLLKQNKEDKGILCDKITIDGFDYYVRDEEIKDDDWYYWSVTNNIQKAVKDSLGRLPKSTDGSKKVIATNNPNIDIPKVVDEVKKLATLHKVNISEDWSSVSFIVGYNKSQESHSNSDEDMIEFAEWKMCNLFHVIDFMPTLWKSNNKKYKGSFTTKELLQLWKEQQPKIVYYG